VQLYALDLSWNRIFAATWPEVLPLVKQLLTKAMYVDLAGNYLPALLPKQLDLQDMLKQHVSFTAPNRYLGSTDWIRDWTSKAHEFRQKAYRSVYGPPTVYDCRGMPFTAAGCREEAEEGSDSDWECGVAPQFGSYRSGGACWPGSNAEPMQALMFANQATAKVIVAQMLLLIIAQPQCTCRSSRLSVPHCKCVLGADICWKSWSRGCFIHWSSYARCLFRRCFLKGVSLKLATVLIVGFISFISFAIITLFELLYFATLIGSWSVMRLHMSAYISLEIRGRCVWQQHALHYCSCPCKAQPKSLAEDLYILS